MTVLITSPFNMARRTAGALINHKALAAQLEELKARLNQAAAEEGFESAFDQDGNVIAALSEREDAETFVDVAALVEDASRVRKRAKRGAQIGAVGFAGALAATFLARKAHERGDITRAIRQVNEFTLPRLFRRRHGALAEQIIKLIVNAQGNPLITLKNGDSTLSGALHIYDSDHIALLPDDSSNIIIVKFEDVTGLQVFRGPEGVISATITVEDYTINSIKGEPTQ